MFYNLGPDVFKFGRSTLCSDIIENVMMNILLNESCQQRQLIISVLATSII